MDQHIVAAGVPGGSSLLLLAMLVLMMVWMTMSARRRARETQRLQQSIGEGDEVISAGGLFGRLRSRNGRRAFVEIAPGVIIEHDLQQLLPVPEHLRPTTTVSDNGATAGDAPEDPAAPPAANTEQEH